MEDLKELVEKFNSEHSEYQLQIKKFNDEYVIVYLFNAYDKKAFGRFEYAFTTEKTSRPNKATFKLDDIEELNQKIQKSLSRLEIDNQERIIIFTDANHETIVFGASTNEKYYNALKHITEYYDMEYGISYREIPLFKHENVNVDGLSDELKNQYNRDLKYYQDDLKFIEEHNKYYDLFTKYKTSPSACWNFVFEYIADRKFKIKVDELK